MNKLFLILILCPLAAVFAQNQPIGWEDLTDVAFEEIFHEEYGDYFLTPEFGPGVAAWENKQIEIRGYALNLVDDPNVLLLSKYPMAQCFFCGMAGPETIMELHLVKPHNYKTDQIITVKGRLQLNQNDVNHCNYILKEAETL